MRGEYDVTDGTPTQIVGSPPLARGVLTSVARSLQWTRITPACAGSTNFSCKIAMKSWDHPRLRGEYVSLWMLCHLTTGSPPLARGVLHLTSILYRPSRITPACAGSTIWTMLAHIPLWDHPRLRGEYCGGMGNVMPWWGSPPLARGVLAVFDVVLPHSRITPACAGSTIRIHRCREVSWDHPRLRGEYQS